MSALNRPDNFAGRVNYAAAVIADRREATRNFDNCFENWDGDVVAVALWRRAQRNPRLAENMPRYLSMELVERNAQDFSHVPTRKLKDVAADMRAKKRAEADAEHARRQAEKEAKKQACIDAGYTVAPSEAEHRWTASRPDGSIIDADCFWQDNAWYMCERDMQRQDEDRLAPPRPLVG